MANLAIALGKALKESCVHLGECYAVADAEVAYDGDVVAEVDGEISLMALAEAALVHLAAMPPKCDPVTVGEDGWSEWLHPTAPSFFSQCCDCGLVHEMEFEIVPSADNASLNPGEGDNGVIIFRARRALASAIEARRATTVQQGAVHESAVLRQQQTPEPGDPRSPDNG